MAMAKPFIEMGINPPSAANYQRNQPLFYNK